MKYPSFAEAKAHGFDFTEASGWLGANDSALSTVPSANVPATVLTQISPTVIEVLTAKKAATRILSEKKVGDWTTRNYLFPVQEPTGSTSDYADYGDGPSSGANIEWCRRDQYIFQTNINYGDMEVDMAAQGKINLIAAKQNAAAEVIAIDSNKFYLLGVEGMAIYGLLNDPNLPAAVAPITSGTSVTWTDKVANLGQDATVAIYNDVRKLFGTLQNQSGALIDQNSNLKLLVSPDRAVDLQAATNFNVSAWDMIKKNFPNITLETVPQLSATSGEKIMLMVDTVAGQPVAELAFGEKMRMGRLIPDVSSFKQKFAATTYGCLIYQPFAIATMSGV